MLSEFSKPVLGKRLLELFEENSAILFPNLISQSPELATERAETFFGKILTQAATNIPDLAIIRDLIFDFATDKRIVDSFIITLPHTHWRKITPIVYKFDTVNNRYIIGPHPIDCDKIYFPVSFAFHQGNIIPFEWADNSVKLIVGEFDTCLDIIKSVSRKFNYAFYPFGISIDFRFKTTLFSNFGGTVELPEEDENSPLYEYSYIISQEYFNINKMQATLTQVAWHPRSDKLLALSEDETTTLNEIRNIIENVETQEERDSLLKFLADSIKNEP